MAKRINVLAKRVLVVVSGGDLEGLGKGWYIAKICEFDCVPRVGDVLWFSVGKDKWPDTSAFGKVETVDWHEGHAMVWNDGGDLCDNGTEASELLSRGWVKTCDPWSMLAYHNEQ